MKVHYFTPYSVEKNLGKSYNECFEMIGEDDWACIRDGDTMFLTPDFGDIVFNYAYKNPGCVLTCYTNRIHSLAKEQIIWGSMQPEETKIEFCLGVANKQKDLTYQTTPCTGPLSGFLMLMSKKTWSQIKFNEGIGLLGVDTDFYKAARALDIPILRMDGLYIWHTYRLGKSITDTTHLK